MENAFLVQRVYKIVMDMLEELPGSMFFHNSKHTADVFLAATEIALGSGLSATEITTVQLAALFHDTGYVYEYQGHEEQSKLIAANILLQENVSNALIDAVTEAIDATKMPQGPTSHVQRVLCDADLFHLAHPGYISYAERLREEWTVHLRKQISDAEWKAENLGFLRTHHYFSSYGQVVLEVCKEKNIRFLSRSK